MTGPRLTAGVIVPEDGRLHVVESVDCWFRLKELQRLGDGSSARITWERRDRLLAMPSYLPGVDAVLRDAMRAAATLDRARPRIAAAAARARAAWLTPEGARDA